MSSRERKKRQEQVNIQWALKNIMARKGGEKSKQMAGNRATSLAQINLVRKEEAF